MKRFWIAFVMGLMFTAPARAELDPGTAAPDFSAPATLGGKPFTFALADALKKGPVVLYFYPAAFTKGCTIEAHDFAQAVPRFEALGATVIGVSRDDIETLHKFSIEACRSAFPVAADTTGDITRAYDAVMSSLLGLSARTSYVITPDGKILYAYHALDPEHHVEYTLKALSDWSKAQVKAGG